MWRRWAGTLMRCSESKSTLSASVMRPRSGAISPAIMLVIVVLPPPEAPNNPVTPAVVSKRALIEKTPSRFSTSTTSISFPVEAHAGVPCQPLGYDQCSERDHDRNQHQPPRRHVAARNLREGIDRR